MHTEHPLTRLLAHCWTPDISFSLWVLKCTCVVKLGLEPHAFKSTQLRISSYFKLQFHQLSYKIQDVSSDIDSECIIVWFETIDGTLKLTVWTDVNGRLGLGWLFRASEEIQSKSY